MELAKGFQLPLRLSRETDVRFKSRGLWKRAKSLHYNFTENVTLSLGTDSESGFGGGLVPCL